MNNDYTIASVLKALKTLKQFNAETHALTLTQLSERCELGKSSMLRILKSLEHERFIKYDDETKKYSLGIEVFNLGTSAFQFFDIKRIASPYLKQIANETKMVLHMAVIEGSDIIIIDRAFPSTHMDMLALASTVGGPVPLHATGVGKVLAAFSDEDTLERLVSNCNFESFSEKTNTSKEVFLDTVKKTKSNGYAFNDCEHEQYLRCLTYPVFNAKKNIIAAISVSGLREVITDDKIEYYKNISCNLARSVSKEFGYM